MLFSEGQNCHQNLECTFLYQLYYDQMRRDINVAFIPIWSVAESEKIVWMDR